jgi:hypothetical protein
MNRLTFGIINELCIFWQGGIDEQSVAQGTPREGQSPETGSPTRAVSSADGTTKTGEGGSSKVHDGVCALLQTCLLYIICAIFNTHI